MSDQSATPPEEFTFAPGSKPDANLGEAQEDSDSVNDPKANPKQGLDKIAPNVELVEANTAYDLKTTVSDKDSGRFIQYNGIATVRIMDPAAWAAANVESDNYFEWNYLNQKRIPLEAFNDDELRYMLRIDGSFSIVEIKDEEDEDESEEDEKPSEITE